ncbi:MAG: TetR/AcrR family transcriptional regulator [SAR324 cluster bacterium]|nr:TetR/AcrR family transcriptional regulator [SAR324 cluster bacterium]
MGRPKEFDPDHALEQVMMAFWRGGYRGTGIQDLVDATGINRASLYGTFGNKQQLFRAVLERYTDQCVSGLEQSLKEPRHPVAGIRHMLDHFIDGLLGTHRGCMIYNTSLELSQDLSELRESVRAGMDRIEALLTHHIRQGQRGGEIPSRLEPVVGACLVMAAMQGMTVRRGGAAERKVLENIRDGAMAVFHV